MVKNILRLEGLVWFLLALYFYPQFEGSWLMFIVLFLTPDISMLGYFKDKKLGTFTYNLVHNYILGIGLVALGLISNINFLSLYGLILVAHVGLDRSLGFGLKYPTDFKGSHIQKM